MDARSRSLLYQTPPLTDALHSNIWAPNRQVEIIEVLGKHYKFSPRLLALVRTIPPDTTTTPPIQNKDHGKFKSNIFRKDDIELATSSLDTPRANPLPQRRQNLSQYEIAKQMINYQSIDVGAHCKLLGTFEEGDEY
jgi:hypothetical protein